MAILHSKQLLLRLLQDEQLTPQGLDDLLSKNLREDLFLEFKDGKQLIGKSGPAVIRQYVSGFANSEGGVLFVGIEDKRLPAPGKRDAGRVGKELSQPIDGPLLLATAKS